MLPTVVRWLGLTRVGKQEHADEIEAELAARQAALDEVSKRLEKAIARPRIAGRSGPSTCARAIEAREQILPRNLEDGLEQTRQTAAVKRELIDAERDFIYQLLREGKITDEARRRIEYELDLEEASLANRGQDGGGWI